MAASIIIQTICCGLSKLPNTLGSDKDIHQY